MSRRPNLQCQRELGRVHHRQGGVIEIRRQAARLIEIGVVLFLLDEGVGHVHVAQGVLEDLAGSDLIVEPHHVEVAVGRLTEGDVEADPVLEKVCFGLGRGLTPGVGAGFVGQLSLGLVVEDRQLDPLLGRPERFEIRG